ncbi:kielin/chordin-like protein [Physella acuta]|uniref:kielin/chordin-like protein n=1 Tax=Physella acuta TaxID=109671 RepID=UPI0027DB113A|nr:kielin/chordin-like protein [Physella acuta]XP_059164971.1 kielin/chordin-like protein [Physella acuta]XP_059164972.1 kielin/chordin-like protein [Physella acuta]XP_059164973.1 kielin/chordin-like protein [Physella acuta]XP_059164974.1 kielin/chordin-like protein [Physella acuta]
MHYLLFTVAVGLYFGGAIGLCGFEGKRYGAIEKVPVEGCDKCFCYVSETILCDPVYCPGVCVHKEQKFKDFKNECQSCKCSNAFISCEDYPCQQG